DVMIEFGGQAGVALAQILMFYPIVYINTMAALGAIDATLVEQAINLGARGWKLIKNIILPLVMPGVLAGSTLVFILSLEDVGAPIIFRFHKVMAYQIYQYFQSVGSEASRPAVAALSFLMLVFATLPLIVVRRYLSLRYYARLARGAPRPFHGLQLGRKGLLSAYLVVLPIIVTAAAPQIGVIILAFSRKWIGPLPEPLPMDNFFANFITLSEMEGVMRSIYNSLTYVAQALVFIAIIGFMAGYATARARLPGASVLDILSSLPLAVPGLVVAFSYYVFFTTYFHGTFLDPVLFPTHVLVLAYIMRKLPFTVRSVFTAVIQTPRSSKKLLGV
ncbi:MAG TPA: iron ABC transporter permease, partial [Pyrodictium sp.]|nr:iron ABC transporter permease [Pyrodictium sp.]